MTTYYMLGCLFAGTVSGNKSLNFYKNSQRSALTVFFVGFLSCNFIGT